MDAVLTDNHPVERKGSRDISQVHVGAYIGKMGEGFREYTAPRPSSFSIYFINKAGFISTLDTVI